MSSATGDRAGIIIRPEQPDDRAAVWQVNEQAFGRPAEATLVEAIHARNAAITSLVAEVEAGGYIAGHILFTPVTLSGELQETRVAAGLGPMAVLPAWQGRGIGGRLISAGLTACANAGYDVAVVLGHPGYYPRFGFSPASRYGVRCAWDVPDEAFMAAELRPGALGTLADQGLWVARYLAEFDGV